MDGRFRLAGHEVRVEDAAPFATPAPATDWLIALHSFAWLRHLGARSQSRSAQASSQPPSDTARAIAARHYVEAWLDLGYRKPREALRADVMARRVLSWLGALRVLGTEGELVERIGRSLTRQCLHLRLAAPLMARTDARLRVRIALTSAAVCGGQERRIEAACAELDRELTAQILPDGGHVGRNPSVLAELLLDLLPLRDAILDRGLTPSVQLCGAIDRMMPMLAFFRHGDGAFASLGGATPLAPLALTALDAREEAGGTAVRNAIYSGYQRLEAASAVLIADSGEMASPAISPGAHASALAFEFSDGPQRIVVNCGVPDGAPIEWRDAARTTAAHSTLTLNDIPSAAIFEGSALAARFARPATIGVEASRGHTASGERLDMRHAGYARRFGLVHTRTLALLSDGSALQGCDALEAADDADGDLETRFALRFHLHPRVTVGRSDKALRLLLPGGTAWTFLSDTPARVEESACVTPERGLRPTRQIVITGPAGPGTRVRWKFARA